jgi:DNA-binding transcriptional ArsR family regulator
MVDYRAASLDRTFAALADPTRRALVAQLIERSLPVSELARPFSISLQAVIKHLDVLADAGLITRKKTGRTVACTLAAEPMQHAAAWIDQHQRAWSDRLDRFDTYLAHVKQGMPDEQKS